MIVPGRHCVEHDFAYVDLAAGRSNTCHVCLSDTMHTGSADIWSMTSRLTCDDGEVDEGGPAHPCY
jgi:hypothetical protein